METGFDTPGDGTGPEVIALAKVVARLRAEVADLEGLASVSAVLERAKGVVMAQEQIEEAAAYDLLVQRAAEHHRTLMEECWITLGRFRPAPAPVRPGRLETAPRDGTGSVFDSSRYLPRPPGASGTDGLPAALADALVHTRTPDDIAGLLRDLLQEELGVDAVMIYTVTGSGRLRLVGHAGIDATLAAQWHDIPPFDGLAALEAVTAGRPLWLEDPVRDAERYLLIGRPPGRWASRAWIPLTPTEGTNTVVGLLRTCLAPFTPEARALIQQAVGLCESSLRASRPAPRGARNHDAALVQSVFDTLPGTAILLSPLRSPSGEVEDYRVEAAAPDAVDVAGRRGKELVGLRILETYPTIAGTPLWQGYLDALTTGTTYQGEPFTYREVVAGVPEESTYSVRAARLEDRLVVSWVRHDTSAREARRLAAMQRLGNLGWADWNLATDTITWSAQLYTIFDRDPARGPMKLEELPEHLVADDLPTMGAAVRRLLGEGRPIDESFRIITGAGTRHLRIVAEARTDADGTPVEVQGFFQDRTAQRDAELALREQERAVLLQRGVLHAERSLAARLRQALLPAPAQATELTGLHVDVYYEPADSGVNVGGDWYSAIQLPDGCALFVVGDVAGHGLDAVGTMAQLRFSAKGMAITGSTLPDVLDRLNALLLHSTPEPHGATATATMVMGRYRPDTRVLTWVRAGHLPPLLVRDGRARYLAQPAGILLGATFDARYSEASLRLEPGDHLVLYTDGLIEDPGEDIDRGLARLAAAAVRAFSSGHPDPLAEILSVRAPGGRDDICALVLHLPPQTPHTPPVPAR